MIRLHINFARYFSFGNNKINLQLFFHFLMINAAIGIDAAVGNDDSISRSGVKSHLLKVAINDKGHSVNPLLKPAVRN